MEELEAYLSRFYRLSELLEEDSQSAEMCMQGELLARYRQCLHRSGKCCGRKNKKYDHKEEFKTWQQIFLLMRKRQRFG